MSSAAAATLKSHRLLVIPANAGESRLPATAHPVIPAKAPRRKYPWGAGIQFVHHFWIPARATPGLPHACRSIKARITRTSHSAAYCSKIKNNRSNFKNTMDTAATTLFGKTRQAVLVQLFEQPETPLYLREISRLTGISPGALQHELNQLLKADLILREEDGNRVAYRANTAHPIFSELQGIVQKTCGLPARIRSALAPLADSIDFAAIYGSVAKGTSHARSDVDLLVVGSVKLQELLAHLHPVEQQVGREVSVRLYSTKDFAARSKKGDAFLAGVLGGPLIVLAGSDDPAKGASDDA